MRAKKVSKWYLIALGIGSLVANVIVIWFLTIKVMGLQNVPLAGVSPAYVLLMAIVPYGLWLTIWDESPISRLMQEQTRNLKANIVVVNVAAMVVLAFFGCFVFLRIKRDRGFI